MVKELVRFHSLSYTALTDIAKKHLEAAKLDDEKVIALIKDALEYTLVAFYGEPPEGEECKTDELDYFVDMAKEHVDAALTVSHETGERHGRY